MAELVAGLSSQIPGFGAGSVHAKSVMNAAELLRDFLPVLRFFPVSIIPPVFVAICLHAALTRGSSRRKVGNLQKWNAFPIIGNTGKENVLIVGVKVITLYSL